MKEWDLQNTPRRFHGCEDESSSTVQTPLKQNPSSLWSPIFQAITPDLNAPAQHRITGTPALQLSLGIQPDLDSSWMSSMETPTSSDLSKQDTPNPCTPDVAGGKQIKVHFS